MQRAAAGRHLIAYADDPDIQDLWVDVGAEGALSPVSLMVTVQNIAADKLDWYIDPVVTMRTLQGSSGAWTVRLTVAVPNPVREETSPAIESFIEGYDDGVHRALVAVYLPEAAYDIRNLDDVPYSEAGEDPPMLMVGKRVFIEQGETVTVALEFTLPPEQGSRPAAAVGAGATGHVRGERRARRRRRSLASCSSPSPRPTTTRRAPPVSPRPWRCSGRPACSPALVDGSVRDRPGRSSRPRPSSCGSRRSGCSCSSPPPESSWSAL